MKRFVAYLTSKHTGRPTKVYFLAEDTEVAFDRAVDLYGQRYEVEGVDELTVKDEENKAKHGDET